jgi:hypothetical protein
MPQVRTQCPGVYLGHPVPGGYKYQEPGPPGWGGGGVKKRKKDVVVCYAGGGPKVDRVR